MACKFSAHLKSKYKCMQYSNDTLCWALTQQLLDTKQQGGIAPNPTGATHRVRFCIPLEMTLYIHSKLQSDICGPGVSLDLKLLRFMSTTVFIAFRHQVMLQLTTFCVGEVTSAPTSLGYLGGPLVQIFNHCPFHPSSHMKIMTCKLLTLVS